MLNLLDRSGARVLIAIVVAACALQWYGQRRIVAEEFALGSDNFRGYEVWDGAVFTASSPKDIVSLLDQQAAAGPASSAVSTVLWLGNSQLHAINQFESGDHLAPYWLRKSLDCADCVVPLGVSLPNVNMQEMLTLYAAVATRIKVDGVVLAAVFDDLREDGLREDLDPLLTDAVRARIGNFPIGQEILARTGPSGEANRAAENVGLEGFVQKAFEDRLTTGLGTIWPLWARRPELRAHVLTDLYHARNFLLGIKATSVRPMIAPRRERNMRALEALLIDSRERSIPVIVYVAPIRQDLPLPYDRAAYEAWKDQLGEMTARYGVQVVNLETLVPAELWGSRERAEVDFMHFRGPGHRLVAEALRPAVLNMLSRRP